MVEINLCENGDHRSVGFRTQREGRKTEKYGAEQMQET